MEAYGSASDFQAYLDSMGLELPAGANLDVLRTIGSSYIDSAYEHRLSCSRRAGGPEQELAWPRAGHFLNGDELPDTFIPPAWVQASYRAGYLQAINPGWATNSTDPNRKTRMEKVDVIQREYFAATDLVGTADVAAGMPADGIINGLVSAWLCKTTRRMQDLFRVI